MRSPNWWRSCARSTHPSLSAPPYLPMAAREERFRMNSDLRARIVEMITDAGEGHIPSAFSIVDIIDMLYAKFLKYDPKDPRSEERDYFVLSKGHGCAALYVVLEKYG